MSDKTLNDMARAAELVRAGRLSQASDLIQETLGNTATTPPLGDLRGAWRETFTPFARAAPAPRPDPAEPPPHKGRFFSDTLSGARGALDYKLFVPDAYCGAALPLLLMLHGCTQTPDDFAAGTRMNALADAYGCIVAYPAQNAAANPSRCWNWFSPEHQGRDGGEPALLASLVEGLSQRYAIDSRRVYIAGLSAGGAMAAVMASVYPELFAAVGVHSGLAWGSATDTPSAFEAMKRGGRPSPASSLQVPTIVFQGDRDTTVNPSNAVQIIAQRRRALDAAGAELRRVEARGKTAGRAYTRVRYLDDRDTAQLEHWSIHGAGHAWSGGSPSGSYTDPRGPDAAHALMQFFYNR